jgi:hypothetical protein
LNVRLKLLFDCLHSPEVVPDFGAFFVAGSDTIFAFPESEAFVEKVGMKEFAGKTVTTGNVVNSVCSPPNKV